MNCLIGRGNVKCNDFEIRSLVCLKNRYEVIVIGV